MLWLIFAFLTAAAVTAVLWPLATRPRVREPRDFGIAVYKAQLAEIEGDVAQSALAPADAKAAKTDAARRLLASDTARELPLVASQTRARLVSLAVLIIVPALSVGLYTTVGRPDLPDAPLSARTDLPVAIAKIEAHLKEHPNDGRGYEVLAPVYLHLGRVEDAVNAARAALRLLGETPARDALYGETLVAAADGTVTPDAKQAFEAAAAMDPSLAMPRFFLGLAAEQAGDKARAKEIWSAVVAQAPEDAPWAQALRKRIAALDDQKDEPATDQAAKIAALPGAQKMAAIRTMVEALAARLAQDGHDVDGWLRLIRSYAVLQEPAKARAALIDARRSLAADPAATARIDALARELGLEG
jgi:cytochrome c-type biogenesis protein CcmH